MEPRLCPLASVLVLVLGCATPSVIDDSSVRIFEEELVLPTYEVGPADPNPRFYHGRTYQGAQGRVYPYPMLDRLTDERIDKAYRAVWLENEYVRLCVLPELGGRLFEAVDKTNGYDFLYRQHVIKPALIGMLGAWISGGIEWNFPHHHRSRVLMPMDHALVENPDGSKTVWLSETDLRHGMRFTIGITLHPGRSYFQVTVKPYNRTAYANSFLYWANVAVHASPDYEVIFPPGTEYATYHGKNAFAQWPISEVDYVGRPYVGVDLGRWDNHDLPVSFFAWNHEDDFLVGYDHGREAGTAYVADHHVAPGKKFWVWGHGSEGRRWDTVLSDEDGPYLELMAGAWSDNQPDYSWIQPYEAKRVEQFWYPIRELGGVKNATLDAAVELEVADGVATIGFHATAKHRGATAILELGKAVLHEERIDIDPGHPYRANVPLPAKFRESELRATLLSPTGERLVAYRPEDKERGPMPEVVEPPPPPGDVGTVEELYLTAQRLEQFHHPSHDPLPYYEEALRRDPGHTRVHLALGIRALRNGDFEEAEARLRQAVARLTRHYTSPRDGEALYYLGLALRYRGDDDAAYDFLHRATWSQAFHAAAYLELARIACARGEFDVALEHLDRSLTTNAGNANSLDLRAAVLRKLGRPEEARAQALAVLAEDPLDAWARHELALVATAIGSRDEVTRARSALLGMRKEWSRLWGDGEPWDDARPWLEAQPFLDLAVEYGRAGLWDEVESALDLLVDPPDGTEPNRYPMLHYWRAYASAQRGHEKETLDLYRLAATMPPAFCFPSRLESIAVLHDARRRNPFDALPSLYLGNLLYDRQPEAAFEQWARVASSGDAPATLYRNLAQAAIRIGENVLQAMAWMEYAVARDRDDPRLLYERDLVYQAGGLSPEERLARLEEAQDVVVTHNDAFAREVELLTCVGRYDEAIAHLRTNHFRKWEGLGNIHSVWVTAHVLRGEEHQRAGRYEAAIADYEASLTYPANLEAARPSRDRRAIRIDYLLGTIREARGDAEGARGLYLRAATAHGEGGGVLAYWQGLALRKLGRTEEAEARFATLIESGRTSLRSLESGSSPEFFAKFGTRRSPAEARADALYLLGLGQLGMGRTEEAEASFREVLALDPSHVWARARIPGR